MSSSIRRIWLVDDSPLDAERARRALASAPYRIEVFTDGASMLEHLSTRGAPDLIILDWVMPGMSGIDVCRFLRSSPSTPPGLKVLLLTSHNETAQIVEGLRAGADDYLAKPYADEELQARVGALIRSQALVEQVARADRTIRSLLDHAPDALVGIDGSGRLTYANAEACRVFGKSADELTGEPIADCLPGLSLGGHGNAGSVPDVVIGDRTFAPTVGHIDGGDGPRTTVSLRDVSERRRAEQRKLDFYSIVAHDLRSPLTTIVLRTKMLLLGKRGLLPADALGDLRKVESSVRSLVSLINDFLDLARMDSTAFKLECEEVEVGTLLEATLEELRPLSEANGLTLRLVRPQQEIYVWADKPRLCQVLSNLLGNALKFTPAKGTVTARMELADDAVQVYIEDTGRGIAKESIPTLFQRYVRGNETQGEVAGTGLGLMIVREIVEAHGGKVGVDSTVGEGSSFWFRIPLLPQPPDRLAFEDRVTPLN